MHIVSINTERTSTPDTVVFNVVQPLDDEVFASIDFGALDVKLQDGMLYVSRTGDGMSFDRALIDTLNQRMEDAGANFEAQERARVETKKALLNTLCASLGVPLDGKQIH